MAALSTRLEISENRISGISWMLVTMLCFITLDTTMKHLLQTYSLVEVTWARFFFATLAAIIFAAPRLGQLAISRSPKLQLLRSILLVSTTGLFNAGIRTVPLATGTTMMFMSPILVTVLSVPILRETVGPRRWFGVAIGFVGALIVVRPWEGGVGVFGTGALFLLIAALLNASYQITTRKLRYDHPLTSLLYTAMAGAIVTSLMLPWHWQWPSAVDWLLFIWAGLAGCLGHLCLIRAFQRAPASVLAPFTYSSLIWATSAGLLVFGEWPDAWTWSGAALIIASGLYIFYHERQPRSDR